MIRRLPSKQRNAIIRPERDSKAAARLILLLVCGLFLAGGFVYAGGRHFAALRLGYQTEKLRVALENAREEQRRLLLEREAASSPARLELAARKLGMQPLQPAQIDPLKQIELKQTGVAATAKTEKPEQKKQTIAEVKRKTNSQVRIR
jgi:cell division protein FtsL